EFGLHFEVNINRVAEAVSEIARQIGGLRREPPSVDELVLAKQTATVGIATRLRGACTPRMFELAEQHCFAMRGAWHKVALTAAPRKAPEYRRRFAAHPTGETETEPAVIV